MVQSKGVLKSGAEVRDTEWGTREFAFRDPDGNGLVFYRPLEREPSAQSAFEHSGLNETAPVSDDKFPPEALSTDGALVSLTCADEGLTKARGFAGPVFALKRIHRRDRKHAKFVWTNCARWLHARRQRLSVAEVKKPVLVAEVDSDVIRTAVLVILEPLAVERHRLAARGT